MPFKEGWPLAVISTTPRSGTWYNHYLFGIYNQLLLGNPPHYVNAANFDLLQGMQLNMSIVQANCPGFQPNLQRRLAACRDIHHAALWHLVQSLPVWDLQPTPAGKSSSLLERG